MSNNNIVKKAAGSLSDERLINDCLRPRIMGQPLPYNSNIIFQEKDVYRGEPWQVLDVHDPRNRWFNDSENMSIYVFTHLTRTIRRGREVVERTAGCGSWVNQIGSKPITNADEEVVGFKKLFVYETKTLNNTSHGHYVMHEYSLSVGDEDSVLCNITVSLKTLHSITSSLRKRKSISEDSDDIGAENSSSRRRLEVGIVIREGFHGRMKGRVTDARNAKRLESRVHVDNLVPQVDIAESSSRGGGGYEGDDETVVKDDALMVIMEQLNRTQIQQQPLAVSRDINVGVDSTLVAQVGIPENSSIIEGGNANAEDGDRPAAIVDDNVLMVMVEQLNNIQIQQTDGVFDDVNGSQNQLNDGKVMTTKGTGTCSSHDNGFQANPLAGIDDSTGDDQHQATDDQSVTVKKVDDQMLQEELLNRELNALCLS